MDGFGANEWRKCQDPEWLGQKAIQNKKDNCLGLLRDRSLPVDPPHVVAALDNLALSSKILVLAKRVRREADLVRDNNPSLTRELEGRPPERLDGLLETLLRGPDGHDARAEAGAGDGAVRLTERVPHTGLKSIGTGGGKHLVDPENVERVEVDPHVERLTHGLHHVTVGADTSSLESLAGDVLVLEEDQADAIWEDVSGGGPRAGLESLDTRVRDTTAEARLRIRTALEVAVATSWSAAHGEGRVKPQNRIEIEKLHTATENALNLSRGFAATFVAVWALALG